MPSVLMATAPLVEGEKAINVQFRPLPPGVGSFTLGSPRVVPRRLFCWPGRILLRRPRRASFCQAKAMGFNCSRAFSAVMALPVPMAVTGVGVGALSPGVEGRGADELSTIVPEGVGGTAGEPRGSAELIVGPVIRPGVPSLVGIGNAPSGIRVVVGVLRRPVVAVGAAGCVPLSHPARARVGISKKARSFRVICWFKGIPPRLDLVYACDDFCAIERHVVQEDGMKQIAVVGYCAQVGGYIYRQVVGLDAVGGDEDVDAPVGGVAA